MQKPVPNLSDQDALEDIKQAIDYLSNIAKQYGVDINIHLNPTYAAYGTPLEQYFHEGTFIPPSLTDVARAVYYAQEKGLTLFVGLYDEGLAVEGGSFIRKNDKPLLQALELFNRNQDYTLLQDFI